MLIFNDSLTFLCDSFIQFFSSFPFNQSLAKSAWETPLFRIRDGVTNTLSDPCEQGKHNRNIDMKYGF